MFDASSIPSANFPRATGIELSFVAQPALTGPLAVDHVTLRGPDWGKDRAMAKTHNDLLKEAQDLGVPTNSGIYKPMDQAWSELAITDWELHKRIKEEKRHRREHRLWIVALVSAFLAVLSAMASWWPVLSGSRLGR